MKKLFIFALAGLGFASCSDDENVVSEKKQEAGKQALSFSTYTAGATRADVVDAAAVKLSGFQVNAVYGATGSEVMYISNDYAKPGVGYGADKSDADIFDTDGATYYWPFDIADAKPMTFYAFNTLTATAPAFEGTTTANAMNVKYTVAGTAATQEDLVVAKAVATAKPTDGVQPLNFTHALSKVNFSFVGADKNTNYTYTVRKIEVITTKGEGVCEIKAESAAPASQNDVVAWTFDNGSTVPAAGNSIYGTAGAVAGGQIYDYSMTADATVNGATATALNNDFMFYPTNDRVVIRVYYKVTDALGNIVGNCGYDAVEGVEGYKTAIIAAANWEAGKSYRYTLTLPIATFTGDKDNDKVADDLDGTTDVDGDADGNDSEFDTAEPIRFSVTVSAWVDATPANTDITIK